MGFRYFYDLPIYRLRRDDYYRDRERYVEKLMFPAHGRQAEFVRSMAKTDPDSFAAWRSTIEHSYGGCWEFNEIVGYIRLHFLGTQVRGEYFAPSKKRIVRSRRRTFDYQTWKLAPEIDIAAPYETSQILSAIREYIQDCRRELPRRYIDDSIFEQISPHVDWQALLRRGEA